MLSRAWREAGETATPEAFGATHHISVRGSWTGKAEDTIKYATYARYGCVSHCIHGMMGLMLQMHHKLHTARLLLCRTHASHRFLGNKNGIFTESQYNAEVQGQVWPASGCLMLFSRILTMTI
jgi:hypothetical protein